MNKLHILAIAAHPDDIELSCAGTLLKHIQMGQDVGIIDLTEGELGTRGSVAIRQIEANDAAKLMGIKVRLNVGLADGFFKNDEESQRKLIPYIRHFKPDIVIANPLKDRHPDHSRGGRFIADACFLAGLAKIETEWMGEKQDAWRPKRIFHMIQDWSLNPDFIVDTSATHHLKIQAIKCYKSQFYNPATNEPLTYIASSNFLQSVEYRDALMGKRIGTDFGEGYNCENTIGITDFDKLILPELP